ncbi:MAG: PadR family transcriptional regulator [Niveispirillum sp.]|uniref:PadR family transcriptional regulator n=1 Tax=Niveispirillum sp. TaxID=1917217 RepID=UPI003BA5BA98
MRGFFGHGGFGRGKGLGFGDEDDEDLRGFGGQGRHGHPGRGGRHGRGFGHGGLRLVLLKLLEDRPRHGYELIKEIEERSQGRYVPSPGVVYPALSWLEDGGLIVIAAADDGRKLARITPAGTAFLAEQAAEVARLLAVMDGAGAEQERGGIHEYAALFRAMHNLKTSLRTRGLRPLSKTETETIVDWIDELARKIERL